MVPGTARGAGTRLFLASRKRATRSWRLTYPATGMTTPPASEVTLKTYVGSVCEALDAADEPVTLVGHSRGGITISQAAEYRPGKVRKLVYLAAFPVPEGQSAANLTVTDTESLVLRNLEINREQKWDMLKQEVYRQALYADCPDADIALANALLTPEPSIPGTPPLCLSSENFGRTPRVYIELLGDQTVTRPPQRKMHDALPCEKVVSVKTSHSAYFSATYDIAAHLLAQA